MSFFDRLRDRWADFHPFLRFIILLIVLAGIALLAGRPSLQVYRSWRTDRTFAAAQQALERHDYAGARELSLQVYRSDPERKDLYPILLRATDALGDPRTLHPAFGILEDPDFDEKNRQLAWQIVCRNAPTGYTIGFWGRLTDEEKNDEAFAAPLFDRLLRDGMTHEAGRLLYGQQQPLPPAMDLRRMKLLIATGSDDAYREFQKILIFRLAGKDADPLLQLLDEIPQAALVPGIFPALSAWQNKSGPADTIANLRLARCEMASEPERAEEIYAENFAEFSKSDPLATARWCFQTRHLADAEKVLSPFSATEDTAVFELKCLIFEQTDQLDKWEHVLKTPPTEMFLPLIFSERAYLAKMRKEPDIQRASEREAIDSATESPTNDALIRLARHAESRGLEDLAESAWIKAVAQQTGPLPLAIQISSLISKLASDKKERALMEVLTAYRLLEPGNPVIVIQHDYLSYLNGQISAENLISDITPIHEEDPDALSVTCILALAHLLEGRPEKALELTSAKPIDWFATKSLNRAVRAIALASTGSKEAAEVYLEDFPWDELLPSEKRVLSALVEASR